LSVSLRRGIRRATWKKGYATIPDIVISDSISCDDEITLVPVNENEKFSPFFETAHLMIELGISIAMADGKAGRSEIRQLSYIMERNFVFTELDIRTLTVLKNFSIINPPKLEKIAGQLLKRMHLDQCRSLATAMSTLAIVATATENGKVRAIERLFRFFGIDEGELALLRLELQLNQHGIIVINPLFEEETNKRPEICLPFPSNNLNALDEKYYFVLEKMLERDSWTIAEIKEIARSNGFMHNAMIEDINTWAQKSFGDMLLEQEDNDYLDINKSLLKRR
jgi:uncharacterized tellurite resistance protein B-like protein